MNNSSILEIKNITKVYPGVTALDDVDFSLSIGEITGLVGENGAGKSTLMNVLGGVVKQTTGGIFLNGQNISINNPNEAQKLGIYFIHQEPKLFLNRSILSNIYINQFPSFGGFIPYKDLEKEAWEILNELGIGQLNVRENVEKLNVGERRLVEIARAMVGKDIKILIMDEPTAAIGEKETEILFDVIKKLSENNVSVIYI